MEIDLQAVRRAFEDVLDGRMSREQADRWAYAVVREEETGVVAYAPAHERERRCQAKRCWKIVHASAPAATLLRSDEAHTTPPEQHLPKRVNSRDARPRRAI